MNKILEVKALEGGYTNVQILNGIDLYVNKGEFVTIIGPNGCGKSTFLKVLFGLATHHKGTVLYNNSDVSGWRTDRLVDQGIAYVPQVDNVFPSLSVRENLQMGGIRLNSKKLKNSIERACNMFPDLQERMNDLAASLSGGERQMLAISRALISEPSFLLLDEPTASLDPDVGDYIRTYIESFASKKGTTILLASHNMNEVERLCNEVLMMKNGEIIDQGTCNDLIKKHGRKNLEETFLKIVRE